MPRRRRPPRAGALTELAPLKLAAQIATLQCLYYLAAFILMLFTTLVAGHRFGMDLVFGWDVVRGDTTQGWVVAFVWLLNGGLCMSVAIVALIARSKLVPDFALTVHGIHLILTSLYSRSLPRHSMWYLTMIISSLLCVALSIWGCRYRELQPVFFGGGRILGSSSAPASSRSQNDEEEGLVAGEEVDADDRNRGRGRARGEQYEMEQMESKG